MAAPKFGFGKLRGGGAPPPPPPLKSPKVWRRFLHIFSDGGGLKYNRGRRHHHHYHQNRPLYIEGFYIYFPSAVYIGNAFFFGH